MRTFLIAAGIALAATSALAQQPANPKANTPAVATPNTTNPNAPVQGANSFTESQAKSRIETNGYSDVSGLQKDNAGVWRGKANKGGKSVNVSVDFQGNVVTQ